MSSASFTIRRATLEDLEQLTVLWQSMHYSPDDLGRRITEFQVAQDQNGKLLGGVALQINERQGRIHSEAFTDFALADRLRPLLWDRLQALGNNHGVLRFWTQERAPFWTQCGLVKADAESLTKLPAVWRDSSCNWLTLKLRDDLHQLLSAEQQFELLMASERERTQRVFQHARILKLIATVIALALFGLVMLGIFFIVRRNPQFLRR
ncbi:MAG: hypothetical protein C5B50_12480 [Verrucomicrobia bacterium]|nr:MAG: hypothetical protein C5B50_12480 [Verrucomicrobiota bacterium]